MTILNEPRIKVIFLRYTEIHSPPMRGGKIKKFYGRRAIPIDIIGI